MVLLHWSAAFCGRIAAFCDRFNDVKALKECVVDFVMYVLSEHVNKSIGIRNVGFIRDK